MFRLHLPLLPLPVLAAVVALSACGGSHGDDPATRVIPPAAAAVAPAAPARTTPPTPAPSDEPPSEEEMKAFARPVPK